ncbi:MAG: hypothetical protein WDZ93_04170 [Candidatus Paceibacterota bacterium]
MFESNSRPEVTNSPTWVMPDFRSSQEVGELERVTKLFRPNDVHGLTHRFYERVASASVVPLTQELLATLDNTDAADVKQGDFETVAMHVDAGMSDDSGNKRAWEALKQKMELGAEMDMPVIVKIDGVYHLMSGNTRLMVTQALGIVPDVLIVDLTDEE